jgi:AhpD family alkylhydroperoxidase
MNPRNLGELFPTHDLTSAPDEVRPLLEAQQKAFGFVPLPTARHATAPAVVEGFTLLLGVFERTSLSAMEKEALALALAGEFDCAVCRNLHTGVARKLGASPELVEALLARKGIPDARLAELVRFVEEALTTHGKVSEEALGRFVASGFTARQALEVVVGIATYTLSIFANRMTRSESIRRGS